MYGVPSGSCGVCYPLPYSSKKTLRICANLTTHLAEVGWARAHRCSTVATPLNALLYIGRERRGKKVMAGRSDLTVGEQCPDAVPVLADGVAELCDVVVAMFVERAQDADTLVARLAVEPHRLVTVLPTLDVLLSLHVEQRVTRRHLQRTAIVDKRPGFCLHPSPSRLRTPPGYTLPAPPLAVQ